MDPHRLAEHRSRAYHRIVAERLGADPTVLERARARVAEWLRAPHPAHHAERWAAFQRDIIDAERTLRSRPNGGQQTRVADHAVLLARKAAILDAARQGLITEKIATQHVAALDEQFVMTKSEHH